MLELFILIILYTITLYFYASMSYPTHKFICRSCDKIVKGFVYDRCKCGQTLCRTDIASDTRLMLKRYEKLGLIKKL
jgi:hypothetical protein